MYLSKSKYCKLWQCPKLLWLDKFKPALAESDSAAEARFSTGTRVGELAKGLFGGYIDVSAFKPDGSPDIAVMLAATKKAVEDGASNICEAAFEYGGAYCAVDVLHKRDGGYAIYEVKSSTHINYIYIVDIAYQKYVLEKCGIKVTGAYVVNIDGDYVFDGTLDINGLFKITDVLQLVLPEQEQIEDRLKSAGSVLSSESEPDHDLGMHCKTPYDCAFWNYCTRHLPKPSVFDLYRMSAKDKFSLYKNGVVSFSDALAVGAVKNKAQLRQIDFALNDRGTYVDKAAVSEFLAKLRFPLYFLDFETMQLAVPEFAGVKPYAQVPFQYSLHFTDSDGGELKHRGFLAESSGDPRRAIAESLCRDIPCGACVLAYNKEFECGRLKELADLFPDLSEHLNDIKNNVIDLIIPFRQGAYYNRAIGGSFSIKSVLPAMFPDDPQLDYSRLEGVHNGAEAMDIFPRIKTMPPDAAAAARKSLSEYCKLDTLAMVKIWQELKRVSI